MFVVSYILYLGLVMAPIQRLVIGPWIRFRPRRRERVVRSWLRLQANIVLVLARSLADLRLTTYGKIPAVQCIVVMNHQSMLDVPLGLSLVRGPYPLIPTRASYARGIPGISWLIRAVRCPLVAHGGSVTRAEWGALSSAADEVARGEQSFLIFPEGHRTRDGRILPFMTSGLRVVLRRARQRPVYVVVVDGLWHLRTFRDAAVRLAGTRGQAIVLGPYTIPPEDLQLGPFIEMLRRRMIETLDRARTPGGEPPAVALPHGLVG